MRAAAWPREAPQAERLLVVDPRRGVFDDAVFGDLSRLLRAGDLVVVNDAATLPASLPGRVGGRPLELRLLALSVDGGFRVVLFGDGSWRM